MKKQLTSRDLKRIESDKKILASAIKIFGEKGYSRTSLGEIARGAGVSTTLAARSFESKEKLFLTAYTTAVTRSYSVIEKFIPFPECLTIIIEETKLARQKAPDAFRLMKNVITTSDLPGGYLRIRDELFTDSNTDIAIRQAQEQGRMPKGDPFSIFTGFIINVFVQVDLAYTFGNPIPSDEYFLSAINIINPEQQRLLQQKADMLNALGSTFESFVYIWPEKNEAQEVYAKDMLKVYYDYKDVKGSAFKLIEARVAEADRDTIKHFLDFSTITERMGEEDNLICDYTDIDGNHLRHILIPIKRNAEGKIIELMAGIRRVNDK